MDGDIFYLLIRTGNLQVVVSK